MKNKRKCGVPHDHDVLYFKILIINIQDNEKCKLLISQKSDIFITNHKFIKYFQWCFQSFRFWFIENKSSIFIFLHLKMQVFPSIKPGVKEWILFIV